MDLELRIANEQKVYLVVFSPQWGHQTESGKKYNMQLKIKVYSEKLLKYSKELCFFCLLFFRISSRASSFVSSSYLLC